MARKQPTGKNGETEPYSMIPNRIIRSQALDPFDKLVFAIIASCNPSYPTYQTIRKWTGMSFDRIWKSLRKLEATNAIFRLKRGRAVQYITWFDVPAGGVIDGQVIKFAALKLPPDGTLDAACLRQTESSIPPDGKIPFRNTETKKTKEKDSLKNPDFEPSVGDRERGYGELIAEAKRRAGGIA